MADTFLERKTCRAGETIFREGDSANQAYIVQEGEVIIAKAIEGKIKVLGMIGKGGIFGEMGLIDDRPRMAMARAKSGVTLIVVSREMFDEKLTKTDPFIRGLLNIFAENIRALSPSDNDAPAPTPVPAGEGESEDGKE
jgi:CRP/FNR family transcriptional regulator, cyclic AMP receptor protein